MTGREQDFVNAISTQQADEIAVMLQERAISKVLIRFARFLDEKNFDAYANCYAEDGQLVTPWGETSGRDGIRKKVHDDLGKYVATQHVSASHDIAISGDTAKVRSSLLATHTHDAEGLHFMTAGGHYEYDLILIDGEWKIARVELFPKWIFVSDQRTAE